MRKLWIIIFALAAMLPVGVKAVVVNNSGSTGADSMSFPFHALDSAGDLIATASGDSVFLRVWYPSGALAFEDSLAYNGAKITAETQHGISTYTWTEAVATIDGTPRDGVYAWEILVHDLTGAALWTPHKGHFQLYQAHDYNVWADFMIDSLQAALDSTQASMARLINTQDTVQGTKDLLDAGLTVTVGTNNDKTGYEADVTAISGDPGAADNFETMLDGTGGSALSLGQLAIRATNPDTAFLIVASDDAPGFYVQGPATTRHAVEFHGVASSGGALALYGSPSGSGAGLFIKAQSGNAAAIQAEGFGTGAGIRATGGLTGPGFECNGGGTSGHGAIVTGQNGNSNGLYLQGSGTGNGLLSYGGVTAGRGAYFLGGTGGQGIRIQGDANRGLSCEGGTNNPGIYVSGDGAGHGIDVVAGATANGINIAGGATSGNGIDVRAVGSGIGFYVLGTGIGNIGISAQCNDASGAGFFAGASGANGSGFFATGTDQGIKGFSSSGSGISGISVTGNGIKGASTSGNDISGYIADPVVPADTTETGKKIALMPDHWSAPDSAAYQGATGTLDTNQIKTCANNNPAIFYGPTSSGSGANSWTIHVIDTTAGAGSPVAVSGAKIAIYDMAESLEGQLISGSSGYATFTVALDSFAVVVAKSGTFLVQSDPNDTITVAINGQTDTVWVTFNAATLPTVGNPDMATLFVHYYQAGTPTRGARLKASNDNIVYDTANGIVMGPIYDSDPTDSTGLASVVVPKSYIFSDSTKAGYHLELQYRGRVVKQWIDYWVIDQDTIRLTVSE